MQLPIKRGKKVYIFGLGHMTKMAARPIYGKRFKKFSSPEPVGRLQICSLRLLNGKKLKKVHFLVAIVLFYTINASNLTPIEF